MPALSFNHFNLRAEQPMLDDLRDFYVDVVGMTVGWRPPFDFPGYWLYLGGQAVLHLVESPRSGGTARGRAGTLDHVAFTCTGLAATEVSLRERSIKYRRADVPGTTQVQLFAEDPSGNGVEFNFANGDA